MSAFAPLVVYELRRREPLLEVRFFRSAPFSGASAIAVAMFMAIGGFLFLNTLYLQDVRGLSPLEAGLYTLPMAGVMMVVSPLCGRVVASCGTRLPLVGGSLAVMISAADPDPADAAHLRSRCWSSPTCCSGRAWA